MFLNRCTSDQQHQLRVTSEEERRRIITLDLLPNPDEEAAVVVVAAAPKPNAVDAVVLAPNEPNVNPDVSSQEHRERV